MSLQWEQNIFHLFKHFVLIEHDQLKADFEALKKKMEAMETKKSPVKSVIDDSDDEVESDFLIKI